MKTLTASLTIVLVALALVACGGESAKDAAGGPRGGGAAVAAQAALDAFIVETPCADPIPATDVRQYGVADADVVTTGRCDEFVDGFAVFTIVDLKVPF